MSQEVATTKVSAEVAFKTVADTMETTNKCNNSSRRVEICKTCEVEEVALGAKPLVAMPTVLDLARSADNFNKETPITIRATMR